MPGGFGFQNYATARKTPSSADVGAALMQQGQQQQPMGGMPGAGAPMEAPPPDDAALRLEGARRMSGQQVDDAADEDDGMHSPNAINVAIGEALTRQGGGYKTNSNPFRDVPGKLRQLQQLGLSETEAMLLLQTGGA